MNRGAIFWGGILVLFGLLLLLSNLGLLGGINVSGVIVPLFLILLGLWLILGMAIKPSRALEEVHIPLQDIRTMTLHINHGAGRLRLSSDAGDDRLLEGSFRGGLERKELRQADNLDLTLSLPQQYYFWGWRLTRQEWNLKLSKKVSIDLQVSFGAGESHLDLRDLDVNWLELKTGASTNHIFLPKREGLTRVLVETGASSVNIRVPEGVAARIMTETALADAHIDQERFPRQAGAYQSLDYETAQCRVEIKIRAGVAAVDVR